MNKRKLVEGWVLVGVGVVCFAGAEQSLLYVLGGVVLIALGISVWMKMED